MRRAPSGPRRSRAPSATSSANCIDATARRPAASFASPIVETVIAPHSRPSARDRRGHRRAQSEPAQPLGQLALDLASSRRRGSPCPVRRSPGGSRSARRTSPIRRAAACTMSCSIPAGDHRARPSSPRRTAPGSPVWPPSSRATSSVTAWKISSAGASTGDHRRQPPQRRLLRGARRSVLGHVLADAR